MSGNREFSVPARNPRWSRDETILLLDLYLRAPNAEEGHPGVVELSRHLVGRTSVGTALLSTYRNPNGIAMKLKNLAQEDPAFVATGRTGLPHGNALNQEVWAAYANDPRALAREVERIRGSVEAATIGGDARPSRGPPPSPGTRELLLTDGANDLYVAGPEGDSRALLPALPPESCRRLVKIGRTNDVDRRHVELNFGFPPGSAISWRMLFEFALPSAERAHRAEQALLGECAGRGWTIGGEFALAPLSELLPLARTAGDGASAT